MMTKCHLIERTLREASDLKYLVNPKVRCFIRAEIFGDAQARETQLRFLLLQREQKRMQAQ